MAGRPPLRIGQHGKITRLKIEDGVWIARCRYRDGDGVTRRVERVSPPDERDEYGNKAEEALRDSLEGRRPPGTGSITSTTTLGELLTRYIARCREDGELAPKSVDTYEATITAVKSRMVGVRVGEADPALINEILRGIRRDHGATRERHTRVALKKVFLEAVLARAITTNPIVELGTERRRKADKRVKGAPALGEDQLATLLKGLEGSEVCASKDLRDPVIVLAGTGLRRGELLALRPEDVDLDAGILSVNGSVVRIKGKGLIRQDRTKGGKVRSVALPQFAVEALRRRKESRQGPNTAGVIFPSSTGTLRDPDNFGKQWREVREDLGLPDVTSHSFRKTVATVIDNDGLSPRFGADQLGHEKPSMTMDVYMSRGQVHPEVAAALDKAVKQQSAVDGKSVE
jgi:integrase